MSSPDIGKQAISKAAEIGLKSQLDQADDLDVDVHKSFRPNAGRDRSGQRFRQRFGNAEGTESRQAPYRNW